MTNEELEYYRNPEVWPEFMRSALLPRPPRQAPDWDATAAPVNAPKAGGFGGLQGQILPRMPQPQSPTVEQPSRSFIDAVAAHGEPLFVSSGLYPTPPSGQGWPDAAATEAAVNTPNAPNVGMFGALLPMMPRPVPWTEAPAVLPQAWPSAPASAAQPMLASDTSTVGASSPIDEAGEAQAARLAAAMRLGQWRRRGTQEYEPPGPIVSGPECHASGQSLTCTMPDGRRYTVPSDLPPGTRIGPGEPNYHYYNVTVPGRRRSAMRGIVQDPTPGPDRAVRPATEQGTPNPAAPAYVQPVQSLLNQIPGVKEVLGSPTWPVVSYSTTEETSGHPAVINVSRSDQFGYPGVVIRTEQRTPSGHVIRNEGVGSAWMQGPDVWPPVRDIRDYLTDLIWRINSQSIVDRRKRHLRYGLPLE